MLVETFVPVRDRVGPQPYVEAALRQGLYDPLDRIREIYMSPTNLMLFCKKQVQNVLGQFGIRKSFSLDNRESAWGH